MRVESRPGVKNNVERRSQILLHYWVIKNVIKFFNFHFTSTYPSNSWIYSALPETLIQNRFEL